MELKTKRLLLRSFLPGDEEALLRIKYDRQILYYAPDLFQLDLTPEDAVKFIATFNRYEGEGMIDPWRCYAIVEQSSGAIVGCLCFGKHDMLFEYELGWMILEEYSKQGYASEAAAAFADYICETHRIDYLIAVMDVDNPASFRAAEKAGFKLFEKRTVYDYSYNRYGDDYYYLRRYAAKCTLADKFYGDSPYEGRSVKGGET